MEMELQKIEKENKVALAAGISDIKVSEEYMINALNKDIDYLLSINCDRMLAGFRQTAGLDMKGAERYEGWENMLIGGHTMGHYLTAVAQAYVNRAVSDDSKSKLYDKLIYIVDALLECQEHSRGQKSFIFGAAILDEKNVELQFDNVEEGKGNIITEAWVPWYTMHKILAGLIDVYELTHMENALKCAKSLGDWVYNRTSSWSEETRQTVLSIEYGGMNDCLYELYRVTGIEQYAIAAHAFDEDRLFDKIYIDEKNALNGIHANTTIPKFMGALNRYVSVNGHTIEGKVVDAGKYLEYAERFFAMVLNKHTYATGGNSRWEHFGEDYSLNRERTNSNNETCNSYNMLKLSKKLFEVTGKAEYLDFYERTFINSILSSQNPITGMTTYFQPMATGFFKVYGERYNKFWCCTGTGMENFTKLGDGTFYKSCDNRLFISMYYNCEYAISGDLTVFVDADFLKSDVVKIRFDAGIKEGCINEKLAFRIPDWVSGAVEVRVNNDLYYKVNVGNGYELGKIKLNDYTDSGEGVSFTLDESGRFICVDSGFDVNDVITLKFPMKVYARTLPDDSASMALCYGPYVLSADLGRKDMKTATTGVIVTIPESAIVSSEVITLPEGTCSKDFADNADEYVSPYVGGARNGYPSFKVKGCDYVFAPHYLKYQERYGVYFYYLNSLEQSERAANKEAVDDRIAVDTIEAGYGQYESDELHQMRDNGSIGTTSPITSRRAADGGSFTYNMAVDKNNDNVLNITVLKEDAGMPLRICSGEKVLFRDVLDFERLASLSPYDIEKISDEKYSISINIPADVVDAATELEAYDKKFDVISVTFDSYIEGMSARVCEYIYMYVMK